MRRGLGYPVFILMLAALFCRELPAQPEGLYSSNPVRRRQALIESSRMGRRALPHLGAALYDEDALVKRTALRMLVGIGRPARDIIRAAVENRDADVRRMALLGLESMEEIKLSDLEIAMADQDEVLRFESARILSLIRPRTKQVEEMLRTASMDESFLVRSEALKGIFRSADRKSLREEHMDRYIEVVKSFNLPAEDWKLKFDDDGQGHAESWHVKDYDDSSWESAVIETAWQTGYVGVGWYRGWFEMPSQVDCDGVEIRFGGVDESSWVWINGEYAGDHDIGPSGWNVPFSFDISEFVKWGGKNQITVRAMNTAFAGGIWQPVTINFLKVR